jgi:hypothetical protein
VTHSEADIQAGIQTGIQTLAAFQSASVVINDWRVLDGPNSLAPFVIITTSDNFSSRQDVKSPVNKWDIPATLIERFSDWPTTLGNLQTRRQAIIDQLNTANWRSAGGLEAVTIDEIRSGGPVLPYYDKYLSAEERANALPQYLMQELILATEEW